MIKGEVMLHYGCKIPSACLRHDENCNLPVMDGYVGEFPIKVLRDGCNEVAVRRSLVIESQLTRPLMLMDESLTEVPTARCFVKNIILGK